MAASVPHVSSSAEPLFDSTSAFAGEAGDMVPRVLPHSVPGFSTSLCLDFQDKYTSLPSYSSNFGSSSSAWEHNSTNSDAANHFFTSTGNTSQVLTMHPHHLTGNSPQHELLVDWHHIGDLSSGFPTSSSVAGILSDGIIISSHQQQQHHQPHHQLHQMTGDAGGGRNGWNSSVEAGLIPFGNGSAYAVDEGKNHMRSGAQGYAVDEVKNHIRSGAGVAAAPLVMPLVQTETSKMPMPMPVVEAKVEASVDTSGAKSMQETSQASSAGRKRRASSSDDKLKDVSCVTSSGVKNGEVEEVKGKRQRNGEGKEDVKQVKTDRSSSDNSGSTSPNKSVKENAKPPEPPKDYIHVRARRGQATDSHSLAERVRREKISERMKFLQDLVPGCNKVTGKAVMLDEIINYVQSLQRQVEFLSMKLAAVNPRLEFNIESLLGKEMSHGRGSPTNFVLGAQAVSYSQQLHHAQQSALQVAGLDLRSLTGLQEAALRRGALPCIDPYSDPISQVLDQFKLNSEM